MDADRPAEFGPDWFAGKRVTVMGLGLFGGGAAVTRFLHRLGARVTVTDLRTEDVLAPSLASLEGFPVRFVLGRHEEEDFRWADMVVASPAVPPGSPFLEVARKAGALLESEMNLFFRFVRSACVVGVTGSNGKTTTTSLVVSILDAAQIPARLGGNIGKPLIEEVFDIGKDERVVLELSSFQLEDLARLGRSPNVSVLTNLTPNHLDRHGTMDAYIRAKEWIFRFQKPGDTAVVNADDPESAKLAPRLRSRVLRFSLRGDLPQGFLLCGETLTWRREGTDTALLYTSDIPVPGRFNASNVLAACAAAISAGAPAEAVRDGVRSFRAVPHRLEPVADRKGATWYNDSIATTPESTLAALSAFDGGIVLIAGGYDKKLPLEAMAKAVSKRARAAILMGATAPALAGEMEKAGGACDIVRVANLEEAVREAALRARPGDVVLLSPGAASFDMFTNFEERGERFRELVLGLEG